MDFFTLDKKDSFKLIKDVVVHPLKVNRDKRGILVETLKTNWPDLYKPRWPFAQTYYSITYSNIARDEDRWHVHPKKQVDRFVVVQGNVVFALYDLRKESTTFGLLNLFKMGESNGDQGQYALLVPKNVLHCFLVVSKKTAIILNYPNQIYDQKEEGRIPFNKLKLTDGSFFSWNNIRKEFKLPLK